MTIRLKPEIFDALHLSALAFGGIGRGNWTLGGTPHCIHGHAEALGEHISDELYYANLGVKNNDSALRKAGVSLHERVSFLRWRKLVGVDVNNY
jgi:hypothetical protein